MAQIGTIRIQTQNNGTVSVPVFDTGDSGSSVYEFVRVQTGSGTGFIPVEDTSNATYPYLRVRSQSHGTVAMTDRSSAIPDNGIWRLTFDNDDTKSGQAIDVWNNNNGTLNNVTTGSSGANQTYTTNEAYDFGGSNSYVQLPTAYSKDDFTYVAWANPDEVSGGWYDIIDSYENSSNNWARIGLRNNNWHFLVDINGNKNQITGGAPSIGTWAHIVGVRENGQIRLYVDGSLVTSGSCNTGTISGINPEKVGKRADGGGEQFNGTIDDARFYSKALTDDEVANLYNKGIIG